MVITALELELDFSTEGVSIEGDFYEIDEEIDIHIDWYRDARERSWLGFVEEFRRQKTVITASKSELNFSMGGVSVEDDFYGINEEIEIRINWNRDALEQSWSGFIEEFVDGRR